MISISDNLIFTVVFQRTHLQVTKWEAHAFVLLQLNQITLLFLALWIFFHPFIKAGTLKPSNKPSIRQTIFEYNRRLIHGAK